MILYLKNMRGGNMSKETYGNDSISKPSDRWIARNRTTTFTGTLDEDGVFNLVKEIVANSLDERKYGKKINIVYDVTTGYVSVTDYGRGLPMDMNPTLNVYNYELLLFTLNAGGKYTSESYNESSGLNGVGLAITVMTSKEAKVTAVRDGHLFQVESENGEFISKSKEKSDEHTGTIVEWIPSDDVFETITFDVEKLYEYLDTQAIVNGGIKIHLSVLDDGENVTQKTYYYENGIKDYFDILSTNKDGGYVCFTDPVTFQEENVIGKDRSNWQEYSSSYNGIFAFTNENPSIKMFHNSLPMTEGGVTLDAIKNSFVSVFDGFIKKESLYKTNEKPIEFSDIEDSLLIITNTTSTGTATKWKHQTKRAVGNLFIKRHMTELLENTLKVYVVEHIQEAKKIANQILVNKRAREKADKTKVDTRKKYSQATNTITDKIENYYPPMNKKGEGKRYLAIVEGLSALGSIATSRDEKVWGIYPTRGKILNCTKASLSKILADPVLTNIIRLIGCGVEIGKPGDKSYTFDESAIQFDKIVIMTDADVDGSHILALYLTFFQRLLPTLLKKGYVYLGVTPRFEITTTDDEEYYAFNKEELETIQNKLKGKKHAISYVKGLGELGDKAREYTFNADDDNLYQIVVDENGVDRLDIFMGKDVKPRKKLLIDSFFE